MKFFLRRFLLLCFAILGFKAPILASALSSDFQIPCAQALDHQHHQQPSDSSEIQNTDHAHNQDEAPCSQCPDHQDCQHHHHGFCSHGVFISEKPCAPLFQDLAKSNPEMQSLSFTTAPDLEGPFQPPRV